MLAARLAASTVHTVTQKHPFDAQVGAREARRKTSHQNEVAEIDLNTIPNPVTPYVLEQTPSVLSMDQGARQVVLTVKPLS